MPIPRSAIVAALSVGCLACGQRSSGKALREGDTAPDIQGISARSGAKFDLRTERGRVVMLTFGYTSCVSVCPLTLGSMGSMYRRLGPDAASVDALFISIDPRRDTLERMRTFLASYDARVQGVMLSEASLPALLSSFGISAARLPPEVRRYVGRVVDPDKDYALQHEPAIWVLDSRGRLSARLDANESADEMTARIRQLLRSRPEPSGA